MKFPKNIVYPTNGTCASWDSREPKSDIGTNLASNLQSQRDDRGRADCPEPPLSHLYRNSCPSNTAKDRPCTMLLQTLTLQYGILEDAWNLQGRCTQERRSGKSRTGQQTSTFLRENGEALAE
jgi:hypothetical protein